MPAIQIPGTNIVYGWETREKGWGRGMNTNLLVMGQVARGSVISRQQSIAPTSPEEGDAYIVPEGATGTWSGKDNTIAAYHSGAWLYIEPFGSPVLVVDEDLHVYWNGEGYDVVGGTGDVNGAAASVDGELPAFSGTSGKALKRTPLRLDADGNLWGAGLKVEEVAGTAYSLTAADNGKVLWFTSADPVAVTLPDNATTAIPGGFNVILAQGGAGVVTAAGEGSDTVTSPDNPIVTSGVGTAVSVIKKADTVWWASAAVQNRVRYVPNIAALRALTGVQDGQAVKLSGDSDRLDGYFVGEASTTPDDGLDVFVTADGKRLRRADIAASNGRVALEIPDSASKGHLLIRGVGPGPTRMHFEPNGHVDEGTVTKLDWMFDPYNEDQTNYRIINIYTKQGTGSGQNGQNGVAVLSAKGVGDHFGIFPSINVGFSDDNANGVPLKVMYFDTSDTEWRTPLLGAWRQGRTVDAGDYILANYKLYQADGAGTTGATKPSHSAGSISDGGVFWTFIRDYQANVGSIKPCIVIGDRDDMPKFGFPEARAQFAGSAVVWNGEKFKFLDNTGAAVWEIGVDLNTDNFHIRSLTGGGSMRFNAAGSFIQNAGLSYLMAPKNESTGATTVSVEGTELLAFGNTTATSVTAFTGKPYQKFWASSGNGQTTLVHGANIRLQGGADRVLDSDTVLAFVMNSSGTVARQVIS